MRALIYVHAYPPFHNAGGEVTMHDLARSMVAEGWDVDVLLSRKYGTSGYELDGVKVHLFENKMDIVRALPGADLLITHLECSERTSVLGRKFKIPVVQVVHNDMDITKNYVAQTCDLAVFNTDWVADSHIKSGFSRVGCIVHPLIQPDRYESGALEREFITLVNLWDQKGSDVFYEMARRFPEERFLGVKGGYGAQDVRDMDNVTIFEHTSSIASDVYSRTKLILMPSVYESFGRVAIEAAAQGVPTVASPTPGLKEALGEAGAFAYHEDMDEWERQIRFILDKRRYAKCSKLAKTRSKYWSDKRPAELANYLILARQVAIQAKMTRGERLDASDYS